MISQSGKSPDLLRNAEIAKAAGAHVVALVNVADSPLAKLAHTVLPLHAGPETSVAATKSYLCSLAALLQLIRDVPHILRRRELQRTKGHRGNTQVWAAGGKR